MQEQFIILLKSNNSTIYKKNQNCIFRENFIASNNTKIVCILCLANSCYL